MHYSCLVWALNLIMEILCGMGVGLVRAVTEICSEGGGTFLFSRDDYNHRHFPE